MGSLIDGRLIDITCDDGSIEQIQVFVRDPEDRLDHPELGRYGLAMVGEGHRYACSLDNDPLDTIADIEFWLDYEVDQAPEWVSWAWVK